MRENSAFTNSDDIYVRSLTASRSRSDAGEPLVDSVLSRTALSADTDRIMRVRALAMSAADFGFDSAVLWNGQAKRFDPRNRDLVTASNQVR
ncbi:hypothetical protein [Qaidamihabitans albus]|uniref:hypothetical protein n=1 Tax=Qaidamihabitans albus TaxID=2795733 RepID=UPI0018F23D0C|nr:hypothetical protein [Qaidamihabitans albus]